MKVICFGDSNTYGYDPRSYFGGRYDCGWVDLFAEKTGWKIINQGCNGRTIPKDAAFPDDTDLLIIMLGTNDLLRSCTPEEVTSKMEGFLSRIHFAREKILLIAPPPMILGEWVGEKKLIEDSFSLLNYYETLAEQTGIQFANAGKWNVSLAFDGVHFTEKGHRAFAEGLLKEITL